MRRWPWVDSTRIGVWGWSGGGSMTLNLMFRYPELYQTGMAVAPVPDERLYDTIYQERYMGLPQENAEAYREGSPITFADKLRGNLLVVHGSGDDNVHYQGTERLINALVAANRPFTHDGVPQPDPLHLRGRRDDAAPLLAADPLPRARTCPRAAGSVGAASPAARLEILEVEVPGLTGKHGTETVVPLALDEPESGALVHPPGG